MASLSVYELVHYLKLSLESNDNLRNCIVEGEISNFHRHSSGHLYFSLKDDRAKISCVMFKSNALKLTQAFKDGDKVLAKGSVSIFENSGSLQLYISDMKLAGIGDLYRQFELLRQKLFKLGLFDPSHKQKKPLYPLKIAVIVGDKSAALSDVKKMFQKRWPIASYDIYPCLVQGEDAPQEIIKTLKIVDEKGYEAIVLCRGGGSIEDLWAFNDEALAYAIYDLKTFIITGIGHEQDFTIADFVADERAPTPTGAIEALTPEIKDVKIKLMEAKNCLNKAVYLKVELNLTKLKNLLDRPLFKEKYYLINSKGQYLDYLISKLLHYKLKLNQNKNDILLLKRELIKHINDHISDQAQRVDNLYDLMLERFKKNLLTRHYDLKRLRDLLIAYDVNHILKKGYALVYKGDKIIKEEEIKKDDELLLKLYQSKWAIKTLKKE